MITEIIQLNIERAQVDDIAQILVDMPNATDVFSVNGKYDLVAIVRSRENREIADFVTNQIQKMGLSGTPKSVFITKK